jgi:hypothetical protein
LWIGIGVHAAEVALDGAVGTRRRASTRVADPPVRALVAAGAAVVRIGSDVDAAAIADGRTRSATDAVDAGFPVRASIVTSSTMLVRRRHVDAHVTALHLGLVTVALRRVIIIATARSCRQRERR